MFNYMTVQETAKICKANRIEGVIHLTRVWLIPRDTEKPADMRRKNYKEMGK